MAYSCKEVCCISCLDFQVSLRWTSFWDTLFTPVQQRYLIRPNKASSSESQGPKQSGKSLCEEIVDGDYVGGKTKLASTYDEAGVLRL